MAGAPSHAAPPLPLARAGVIFDMDGVLVDSFPAHLKSWHLLADEIGRPVSDETFARGFGLTNRDFVRLLFGAASDADVQRLSDRKEALYRDLIRGRVPLMPGAAELARELARAGARLAIGSSGPPANVALVADSLHDAAQFAAVVTGADVQRGKPDPEVFLLAAARLTIPPTRCVVIEDAPVGVEAARRAGMKVIGLASRHHREPPAAADLVVGQLSAVSVETISQLLA